MLQFLRKYSRSWVIWAIILGIVVVFIFWGVGGLQSRSPLGEVARVNGQPILRAEYQKHLEQLVQKFQEQSHGEVTEKMAQAIRLWALQDMIAEAIIMQAGDRLGLRVSDAELQERIRSIPGFQRGGKFDENLYYLVLSRNHLTSLEFEEQMRRSLRMEKVMGELASLAKVSDADIQEAYRVNQEAVRVSYLAITPDRFMAQQHPGEAEISQYYRDHQEELRLPARAKVSYLLFRQKDFQERVKIDQAQVDDFIKAHPAEFLRPKVIRVRQIALTLPAGADAGTRQKVEKQVRELLEKLEKGENFAELAKQYSQDPGSRAQGGELGEVRRGAHPAEWDRVAFALQPGEVGRADTPGGIYLLKLEGVEETEKAPEAEDKATQLLKQARARDLAREAAKEARWAFSQGAVAEVAKKYGVTLAETPWITLKDQVPGLGPSSSAFSRAALELKVGEVSRVVDLPEGEAVMKSLEYQAESLPPLAQIRERVVQEVEKQGAKKAAEAEAARLLTRLQQGEALAKVAAAAGVPVKESRFFTRFEGFEGQRQAEAVTSAAFLLSRQHPYPDGPVPWQDAYYLLAFKERRPPDQAELQKNWEMLKRQLLDSKKQMILASWLDAERRRAKIQVFKLD